MRIVTSLYLLAIHWICGLFAIALAGSGDAPWQMSIVLAMFSATALVCLIAGEISDEIARRGKNNG